MMTTVFWRKAGQTSVPRAITAEAISFTTDRGKAVEVGECAVSDAELVRAAQGGDAYAMETLFQRHEVSVFRLALRILRNPDDADDARQETFARVFGSLSRFRRDASFKTYALAICSNLCRDRLRSDRRRPESLYGLAPSEATCGGGGNPGELFERGAEQARVRQVIATLAPMHRETLHLRYVEELSADEIAIVVG